MKHCVYTYYVSIQYAGNKQVLVLKTAQFVIRNLDKTSTNRFINENIFLNN